MLSKKQRRLRDFFFNDLFERQSDGDTRKAFRPLIHCPRSCNGQGWARPTPEPGTAPAFPTQAARSPVLGKSSTAFQLVRTAREEADWSSSMGCWHSRAPPAPHLWLLRQILKQIITKEMELEEDPWGQTYLHSTKFLLFLSFFHRCSTAKFPRGFMTCKISDIECRIKLGSQVRHYRDLQKYKTRDAKVELLTTWFDQFTLYVSGEILHCTS